MTYSYEFDELRYILKPTTNLFNLQTLKYQNTLFQLLKTLLTTVLNYNKTITNIYNYLVKFALTNNTLNKSIYGSFLWKRK